MGILDIVLLISSHFYCITISAQSMNQLKTYMYCCVLARDKKGWTQRVGLANVSPKGLYHGIRGWFKLDSGS